MKSKGHSSQNRHSGALALLTGQPGDAIRRRRALALAAWGSALAVVWLVVLPWWANSSAMQAHLDWLEDQRVDPSAMYYTELEAMKPILHELNARHRAE